MPVHLDWRKKGKKESKASALQETNLCLAARAKTLGTESARDWIRRNQRTNSRARVLYLQDNDSRMTRLSKLS